MSTISSPDTFTTTLAAQRINLPETQHCYTLRNNHASNDIWWHSNLSITDASIANKTAAQLRTAGCSRLKGGELNTIEAKNAWVKVVYASDGGAATIDIEPGVVQSTMILNADLEIGNVGVLNSVDAQINPARDESAAVAASGAHMDNAAGGTAADTTYSEIAVEALATYRVHAVNGVIYMGIAACTTDANILWVCGAGQTVYITIPSGTAFHYMVDTAGVEGRLARVT